MNVNVPFRDRKRLLGVATGLLAVAMVAGTIQSLRVSKRLPQVDMLANGSLEYVDVLLARKEYDRAIRQLKLLSRLLPQEPETYEYLGTVLGQRGRPDEAREPFQELVRLRPDYAEGYNFLGATYFETQQFGPAAELFEQALKLKPDFPQALNNLGMSSAHLGKLDVAEKCFARAVELSPDDAQARANRDWTRQQLRAHK